MRTRELPKKDWERYFDALSNLAHNEPRAVSLELTGPELGDQLIAERVPLRAITFETKGSQHEDIDIEVGDDTTGKRLVHRAPARVVWLQEDPTGQPVAIDIEGEDAETQALVKTLIRFEVT